MNSLANFFKQVLIMDIDAILEPYTSVEAQKCNSKDFERLYEQIL